MPRILGPLLAVCVLKHVCTRLIILTSKIKIAESGQLAVGSRQSASTPSTANILFIISENAEHIDCLYGEEGKVCEKVGPVVKWASRYY